MVMVLLCMIDVSIHAPTKGATLPGYRRHQSSRCFNPRSYERSDFDGVALPEGMDVSIHAPTKGATTF